MAILTHEIWEETNAEGDALHTCCIAGPMGDDCRRMLGQSARLLTTFQAGSHFEAMIIYHRILGREPYVLSHPMDSAPYPDGH
jgi:hypothetical protein